MSGAATPRGEEPGRLSGARGEFVSSLPRRLEMLRSSLQALEQVPADSERQNGLLRRLHALGSSARVLGFASVAEALAEAEKGLRGSLAGGRPLPLGDLANALDLLPSLIAGAQGGSAPQPQSFPISVLVFGPQGVADAIAQDERVSAECERTEDPARARELMRIIGPDVAVIDADRRGARELVELVAHDPLIEPVPVLVIGSFEKPDAAAPFVELGASRVLPKPVSPETLRRTVDDLRELATRPRPPRAPLGELNITELSERMAEELKRGLLDAVEGTAQAHPVAFGEGADVLAAVWGAVARVRELVTLRSQGAVRFQPVGPEGAVPVAPWAGEERRAGERLPRSGRGAEGISLQGRRVVVADDDPAVVWFMTSLLKAVGAEVIEAHDGKTALEITRDLWPDVVISDVLMPELDGFSLCHEIKRDVAVRDTPVILLSWKEDLLQRLRELGADADGYLRKEAAASAVVERVREVLRPRARVEQRIEAGGEVRGRLDGLTARLLLELTCRHRRDARISVRDAVYLWELLVREGRLLGITRSSAQGDFARGPAVLPGLLGVSAGRFVIEPDSTPARAELEGDLRSILEQPVERARAALRAVTADALVRITSMTFDRDALEPYLSCTPEPALSLTRRLLAAVSPRDLVLDGHADPRLLENVLSDLARRGAIVAVEREAAASLFPPAALAGTSVPPASDLDWNDELSDEDVAPDAGAAEPAPSAEPPAAAAPAAESAEPPAAFAPPAESAEPPLASPAPPGASPPPVAVTPPPLPLAESKEPPAAAPVHEPVVAQPEKLTVSGGSAMPLNPNVTPAADWTVGPLFAFGAEEHGTLPGMGSAQVALRPAPAPASAPSPSPPPQAPVELSTEALVSEPPPTPEPEDEDGDEEDAELAEIMGLSRTPAPSVAKVAAPVGKARSDAAPAPGVDELVPADVARAPLSERREKSHSPISEPPAVPSAPLTTEALLAAVTPAAPPAEAAPIIEVGEGPASADVDDSELLPEEDEDEEALERERESKRAQSPRKPDAPNPKAEARGEAAPATGGGVWRSLLVGLLSFAGVYLLVTHVVLKPDTESVSPAAVTSAPLPLAPAKPTAEPPRIEQLPIPQGIEVAAGSGLLEIEVSGPEVLYVDGTFVGRGPTRRVPLAPGKHALAVGEGADGTQISVDVAAGSRTRVSLPVAAPKK